MIHDLVQRALEEDIGAGDATTEATIPGDLSVRARIVARQPGILAGRTIAEEVFLQLSEDLQLTGLEDEAEFRQDQVILELAGPAAAILQGERVALNFLQRLCGIATLTAQYVEALQGTGCRVADTRKTTPTLRQIEKYAVLCGGGVNHRFGLDDMLLIKENHIAAAGSIEAAIQCAQALAGGRPVEVEVRDPKEFVRALALQPDRIMLDHWSQDDIRWAVQERGSHAKPELEVSGNLQLETIRSYAIEGVQYLSVGALTHSAPALDLSMLLEGV